MIDEKKLIEAINNRIKYTMTPCNGVAIGLRMAIETIESQPKTGEWIPVSERLPEENGIYIVDDRIFDNPWVHTAGFVKTSQCWAEHNGVYYDDEYCRYDDGRIVAWQPLPKPYRGDTDDSTM